MHINAHSPRLNDELFTKFGTLVYEKTGIFLKPGKKELLNARLQKRLRHLGLDSFQAYYDVLARDTSGEEVVQFINCVSTNFTSFFREKQHFDLLESRILPEIVGAGGRGGKDVAIWSSACSSGEEPYTIGMVMEAFKDKFPACRYQVIATDISTKVLDIAERGIYPDDKIGQVPYPYLKRFFRKGKDKSAGFVKVRDELRSRLTFQRFNLMDTFPWQEKFDIIFCRNVMIYFNRKTQQDLINKFYGALVPGGSLFIGHSESISSLRHNFNQIESTVFRK